MVESTKDDEEERYELSEGGVEFGTVESLEECMKDGCLVMNGYIKMVFCWQCILLEGVVCLLVCVLLGICEVGVFKLFKLCTSCVHIIKLWGKGGLVINFFFSFRDGIEGGGRGSPWIQRACFNNWLDIM